MTYFDSHGFASFCAGLGDDFSADIIDGSTLEFSNSGRRGSKHRFHLALRSALAFLEGWLDHYDDITERFSAAGLPPFKYNEVVYREIVSDVFDEEQWRSITGLGGTQTKGLFFTLSKVVGFVLDRPNCLANEQLLLDRASLEAFFARIEFASEPETEPRPLSELTLDDILAATRRAGLVIPKATCEAVLAALRSDKHLLLTGAPGTGKTTFALALADAARRRGACAQPLVATGTADWTSVDTLGGYWLNEDQQLEFRPGLVLHSAECRRWLVVDEFNRADIDKAFGALFTVLSGHGARLPYRIKQSDGSFRDVEIVEAREMASDDTHPFVLGRNWRLIGTLNDWDRDLLFDMSFALQRRFAVISVDVPGPRDYQQLINEHTRPNGEPASDWAKGLAVRLAGMPPSPLGPAIILDVVDYLSEREAISIVQGDDVGGGAVLAALQAFVVPQMVHLARIDRQNAIGYLLENLLPDLDRAAAGRALAAAIDIDANVVPSLEEAEEDLEALES